MPELPEVETIRLQLAQHLVGHKIEDIEIRVPKIFPAGSEKLIGGKVKGTRRFGKVLVVDLDNGYSFLVHLKLTGQVVYSGPGFGNVAGKFTHVIFTLSPKGRSASGRDKGAKLFFNDSRKFGWVRVEKTAEVVNESFVKKLGPEPQVAKGFAGQALTLEMFRSILSKSRRPVKLVLLDQERISGIGNIYANDALWLAAISPRRSANSLSLHEVKKLYDAVHEVLKRGLKYEGASDQWYITAEGKKGKYQEHFLAYGQQGEPCPRPACRQAGARFTKFFLGGRGTYICPNCQKE